MSCVTVICILPKVENYFCATRETSSERALTNSPFYRHDVVEAIAKMPWCNGSIGMAGNSALAISQWFIAAEQPPALKAIAPWEGAGDIYREQFFRGGWFSMSNFDLIAKAIVRGKPNSGLEDYEEMYRRSPVSNEFWEDKRVDMTKIKVPAFIRGSDVSTMHTMGSVRGWLEIPHNEK